MAIALLDSELMLLEKRFTFPERFAKEQVYKSNLHIIPKSKDLGIIGLYEIVEGLFLSEEVLNAEGIPANKSEIARKFELMFNISFGRYSEKTSQIYDRKPFNRTRALDCLRNHIIRNGKSK